MSRPLGRSTATCILIAAALMTAMATHPAAAKKTAGTPSASDPAPVAEPGRFAPRQAVFNTASQPDTTVLGAWDFDNNGCDAQGWTMLDFTAQDGDFVHVEDFAGLNGGTFGKLYPLEGAQSIWCGARPDANDPALCAYAALPGYGNSWDQGFCTAQCLSVTGNVTFDYLIAYYSEPGYDQIDIEYDLCDGNWTSVRNFSGEQPPIQLSDVALNTEHSGSLRWRVSFRSDGAWSDQDGLWNTDGAYILDSLTVRDATGVLLPTELMETESVGDLSTASGNWVSCPKEGFGDFSGLFSGVNVVQEDPCHSNLTCLWGFFNGSPDDYACGGFPDQKVVPYGNSDQVYIDNHVVSPLIPLTGTGSVIEYNFDTYFDLPLNAVVFYMWFVRSIGADGCPGQWKDRASVGGYGDSKTWQRISQGVDDLISPTATHIQVALGVRDMCRYWCGTYGTGDCHTHSPLFDNVEVLRIDSGGPVWAVRDIDLFQDNFSADGTTTGTVRIDTGNDILPNSNPNIRPGDSTVVTVWYPEGDLAGDAHTGFGPAVYAYVNVRPPQPGKSGNNLTEDSFRWPVVDSLSSGGDTWYCVRMDSVFTSTVREYPQWDRFCVDLNDGLFTPGDTIRFFFAATSGPPANATHYYSEFTGVTDDIGIPISNPMEVTCLPTSGADILYVDDYNPDRLSTNYQEGAWEVGEAGGAEPFFQTAFRMLGIEGRVDRYDVRSPRSGEGNGPGGRVVDVSQQLVPVYRTIIWNTGDLFDDLIGDGVGGNDDKANDFALLYDYIDNLPQPGGLYLSGDNLAYEWNLIGASSGATLRSQYIDFGVTSGDHYNYGLALSPLVVGETGGCFSGDSFFLSGGCPAIATLDVLGANGAATVEASYASAGSGYGAVIAQSTTNAQAQTVGVVLSGFSYDRIRDAGTGPVPARVVHLQKILEWLGNSIPTPTPAGPNAFAYALDQNYPNPFNPTTTIEFSVKELAPTTLRVYDVAGRLVATLVDDTRTPGVAHRVEWDGRNDAGQSVASGVYFYRLATKNYTQTRKMVLLK